MRTRETAKSRWILTLAGVMLVVAALYLARGVLIPFTLGVLLSFLLSPVCRRLEQWRLGRVPSVVVTTSLTFALLSGVTWIGVSQLTEIASNLPEYRSNVQMKTRSVNGYVKAALGRISRTKGEIEEQFTQLEPTESAPSSAEREVSPYPVRVVQPPTSPYLIARNVFGSVLEVIGTASIVVVLVIFFLIRREDLRDRFIHLVSHGRFGITTQALDDAAERVRRYLTTQLTINASYGTTVAVSLFLLGVPMALLWGLMGTIMRFIPYVGPWLSAVMPIMLSLAVSDGWTQPLITVGVFVVLELMTNLVLEPWLYGSSTGVSPVAVLLSAVFWTWLWGGVGLILATPLTVCLAVAGKHVPQLGFLNILLGDEPVFDPKTRVFQRLLAGDQEEATELVEEYRTNGSLVDVYDSVLIPVLALAEISRHRGELDGNREEYIWQGLGDIVEELGDRESLVGALAMQNTSASTSKTTSSVSDALRAGDDIAASRESSTRKPCIVCLPARDKADGLSNIMLTQLLDAAGLRTVSTSVAALASEKVELAVRSEATVVCISAMPPAAVTHARYLCKRVLEKLPNAKIVVGLWDVQDDMTKAKERLQCGGDVRVVRSLNDAQLEIRRLTQYLSPAPDSEAGVVSQGPAVCPC